MRSQITPPLYSLVLFIAGVLGGCSLTTDAASSFASKLGPLLSPGASISFPGSEEFSNATVRWSTYGSPSFVVVVSVATDSDVQQAVKVANAHSLPFLATSGHHGACKTLGAFECGVNINLRRLNSVVVRPDGHSADIQGGVLTKEVTDALWNVSKWTVTGVCECTSLMGPGLGGGHGWNQGRYGLGLDQFIDANVVLGDGSLVNISEESESDLFWAMRGAGHNFGIVTSVHYKIYNVPKDNMWFVGRYTFTQDKLEEIFDVLNKFTDGGNQPIELRYWANFLRDTSVDAEDAVILAMVIYEGTEEQASPYSDQLLALGPVVFTSSITSYPGLGVSTGMDQSSYSCQNTGTHSLRFPIDLKQFNTTAHRQAYNLFNRAMKTYPLLNRSLFLNEGYSVKAVQEVAADSTAYPDRYNNLLLSASFRFDPDSKMDQIVTETGLAIRKVLFDGSGSLRLNTYVNYALGVETLEDWYGHEKWRIDKLRSLKAQYDPGKRFHFYAPIE